jgi:hypothetical protein
MSGAAAAVSPWHRRTFEHDGLRFSCLDTGGTGPLLVLLHAHWMGASDFDDVVAPLADGWRERVSLHQLHPLMLHAVLFRGGYVGQSLATARRWA